MISSLFYTEENNEITIIGYTKTDKEVNIPNEIDGKPVTHIGNNAFEDCSSLTTITIPNSVTSIGNNAFSSCSSLTTITIPNSVTSIGEYAFEGCNSLNNVIIPNSVTSIGDNIFCNCSSLSNIIVDDNNKNYTDIDGVLFDKNKNKLITYPAKKVGESYEIPNSVISIEEGAFSGCSNLSKIIIPNSVTSIKTSAFSWNDLTIYGYKDSYAETYAKENSIQFKYIDGSMFTKIVDIIIISILILILFIFRKSLKKAFKKLITY